MKKIINLLLIFSLLFTNTMTFISCKNIINNKPHLPPISLENELKVNSETNIDLDKSYLPHPILLQKRDYKGTFFNQYQTKTIKHLTNAFLSKTENLNLSTNGKTEFNTYKQLQNYLNLEQQNYWENLNKNICQKYQDNLKQLILSFYNFTASILNKTNINHILKKIEIKNIIKSKPNILGQANNHQTILINKKILSCAFEKAINSEWHKGQFTTNNFFHVIAHEWTRAYFLFLWLRNI